MGSFKHCILLLSLLTVGWLACQWVSSAAKPPNPPVVQRDFRILDYYRGSPRLRTLLRGAEAEYLSHPIPIRKMTIESYTTTGVTSLVGRAESCFADRILKTASSQSPIDLILSGGAYFISGEGFFWSQTNNVLIISNQVSSRIRGGLLEQNLSR